MRRMSVILAASSGVLLCARSAVADFPPLPGAYDVEGPFVCIPASATGMMLGLTAASVAAIICSPVDLFRRATGQTNEAAPLMESCGEAALRGVYYGVYYVVGAPFYLTKKAFWDLPKTLLSPHCHTPVVEPTQPAVEPEAASRP